MPTPGPGLRAGRRRRPAPPGQAVLLTLLAVLALLLGSGAATIFAAPGQTSLGGPGLTGLGNAPPTEISPPASPATATPAAVAGSGREPSPTPAPEPSPDPPPVEDLPDEITALEDEVTALTNAARADAGCDPVRIDERLRTAARGHSEDMAANDYFSHTGQDGRSPFDRMRDAGYPDPAGENIAMGYRTPADVMDGWMNSDGHRQNLLTCSHQAIGVGLGYDAGGRPYWTQVFGR